LLALKRTFCERWEFGHEASRDGDVGARDELRLHNAK
jgi:hypothetical protein